jgi:peptidoglycan/xylan/chitin deacetylase (PgdA/CDA1 family)
MPFDPGELITNLRFETYARPDLSNNGGRRSLKSALRRPYYLLRPFLPVGVRKHLQRSALRDWDKIPFPSWPVDTTVERFIERLYLFILQALGVEEWPFIWFWPEGYQAACILTHDVETQQGRDFCSNLMALEQSLGWHSSFEIVPEQRYDSPPEFLDGIRGNGCEICIHGLNHDGHLFDSETIFRERAVKINKYATDFEARGFRSPVMYRNPQWFAALEFEYDMSMPNVGHLDPQRGGCCTVMPYFIGDLVELPLTTIQDYSLFHILGQYSLDLWKQQIALITERNGLVSFIIHPDYMIEPKALKVYESLLNYLNQVSGDRTLWKALPKEVASWWRQRSKMELRQENGRWVISGDHSERARIAYARIEGNRVTYRLTPYQ